MFAVYPAYFMKEEDGGYSVLFPDLPGAVTCGEDFEEANRMAMDCLAGYIFTNEQLDMDVPNASDIHRLTLKDAAKRWECDEDRVEIHTVCVDVTDYAEKHFRPLIHKNVSIKAWVNEEAKALGINFSQTLEDALVSKIKAAKTEAH